MTLSQLFFRLSRYFRLLDRGERDGFNFGHQSYVISGPALVFKFRASERQLLRTGYNAHARNRYKSQKIRKKRVIYREMKPKHLISGHGHQILRAFFFLN